LTVVIVYTWTVLATAEHVHHGIDEITQHGKLLAPRSGHARKNPGRIQSDEPGSDRTRSISLP
jgi:hypothetical protein